MIREILRWPHPSLRADVFPTPAHAIAVDDRVRELIADMKETLLHEGGLGLAAPQIGELLPIIVVRDILIDRSSPAAYRDDLHAFVNPRIMRRSLIPDLSEEGCLSDPQLPGKARTFRVRRSSAVEVVGVNEDGFAKNLKARGLLAYALQHEFDHLRGLTLFNRAEARDLGATT